MQEVYDFLKKCGTYYLATVEDAAATFSSFTEEPKTIQL